MKRQQVTPEMLKMMDPKVAAEYGYLDKLMPKGSHGEPTIPKLEREEHGVFENWLIAHSYAYRHSRTDKATRETCGAPDFTVYEKDDGVKSYSVVLALAIEFKLPGGKLSEAQKQWAAKYGGVVHVLPSAQEAIDLVKREFGE